MKVASSKGNSISNGDSLSYTSLYDSYILRCNSRMQQNYCSEVGKKLWKSITNSGVTGVVETT